MQVKDVTKILEEFAPLVFQEEYDNAGLIVGNYNDNVKAVLITLDVTEAIIDEAIDRGCDLIISHHPIIMRGIKRLNGSNYVERSVIKAIKHNIAIYASHTNSDNVLNGVNGMIAKKIGLQNCRVLAPQNNSLLKLVTYAPVMHAEEIRTALFKAGAGEIGNYDSCSFNAKGQGTFKANDIANPYVGEVDKLHYEDEVRIETVIPAYLRTNIINTLISVHPYEEVAYDLFQMENKWDKVGSGLIGELLEQEDELAFLMRIKDVFKVSCVKYTTLLNRPVKRVALCGGAGSFLVNNAKSLNADVFISGDFKYHQYFDAENKLVIADIGHFESEQFTKELFFEILTKKIPNFVVCLSKINTNPIKYL